MADDTVSLPTEAPREVSRGFRLSAKPRIHTLHFEDLFSDDPDPRYYFVKARPLSSDEEDEVVSATLEVSYERHGRQMEASMGTPRPNAAFIAKCRLQITDFRLPADDEEGNPCDVLYNERKGGKNDANEEIYERLRMQQTARERIEAFLDEVGGRSEEAEQDWNDLGNSPTGSPESS